MPFDNDPCDVSDGGGETIRKSANNSQQHSPSGSTIVLTPLPREVFIEMEREKKKGRKRHPEAKKHLYDNNKE